MGEINELFWRIKSKNTQISDLINAQLDDVYYQNGKNGQIQKIYDNFHFLVLLLVKIIINFSNFSIFLIYVIVIFN